MLLQRQSVLVGIPIIPLSVRSLSFFERETDFFVSALNPALFLLSFSFCSLVNGTFPLKMLSAHSHSRRDCDRIWWWGVYEYTVLLFVCILYHWRDFSSAEGPCYCFRIWCKSDEKRGVTSIFMNRHTLSVPHRERYCSSVARCRGILFHIDHHVAVRSGRSSGKGF